MKNTYLVEVLVSNNPNTWVEVYPESISITQSLFWSNPTTASFQFDNNKGRNRETCAIGKEIKITRNGQQLYRGIINAPASEVNSGKRSLQMETVDYYRDLLKNKQTGPNHMWSYESLKPSDLIRSLIGTRHIIQEYFKNNRRLDTNRTVGVVNLEKRLQITKSLTEVGKYNASGTVQSTTLMNADWNTQGNIQKVEGVINGELRGGSASSVIANSGFDTDANVDNIPDNWTATKVDYDITNTKTTSAELDKAIHYTPVEPVFTRSSIANNRDGTPAPANNAKFTEIETHRAVLIEEGATNLLTAGAAASMDVAQNVTVTAGSPYTISTSGSDGVIGFTPAQPVFNRDTPAYKNNGTQAGVDAPRFDQRIINLLTANQSAATTDNTGWTVYGAQLSRDTAAEYRVYGTAAFKIDTNNADLYEGVYSGAISVNVGQAYTFSTYLCGTGTVKIDYDQRNDANDPLGVVESSVITLTATPTRYSVSGTMVAGTTRIFLHVKVDVMQDAIIYFSGSQFEQAASATPWVLGGTGEILGMTIEQTTQNILTANCAGMTLTETAWTGNLGTEERSYDTDAANRIMGTGAAKFICDGVAQYEGAYTSTEYTVPASQTYTASVYLRGSGTVRIRLRERTAALAAVGTTSSNVITLTSTPTRYSVTRAFGPTGERATVLVTTDVINAATFYISGAQLEQRDHATSWIDGTATRNADDLKVATNGVVSLTEGTVEALINYTPEMVATGRYSGSIFRYDAADGSVLYFRCDSVSRLHAYFRNSAVQITQSYFYGDVTVGIHRVAVRWSPDEVCVFLDGVKGESSVLPYRPTQLGTYASIGTANGSVEGLGSQIADFIISNRARTDGELATRGVLTPLGVDSYTTYYMPLTDSLSSTSGLVAVPGTPLHITAPSTTLTLTPSQTNSQWPTRNQIENKTYDTSYVIGTRAAESLAFNPTNIINLSASSIGCWLYVDNHIKDVTANRYIFSHATSASPGAGGDYPDKIALFHTTGGTFEISVADHNGTSSGCSVVDSGVTTGWHFFVIRWSSARESLWIDGAEVANRTTSIYLPSVLDTSARIGTWINGTYGFINTAVRGFFVANVYISDAVCLSMYNAGIGAGRLYAAEDIKMYLPLNEVPAALPSFTRATVAYKSDGTQITSGNARFEIIDEKKCALIESATVNKVVNSFLNGTYVAGLAPNWGKTGVPAVTENTLPGYRRYGGKSQRIVATVAGQGIYQSWTAMSLSVGQSYFVKALVYVVSGVVRMACENNTLSVDSTGTGWQELSGTMAFGNSTGSLTLYSLGAAAEFYVDAVQVENKSYSTSFHDGTRNAEVLTIPTERVLTTAGVGTIEMWVYVTAVMKAGVVMLFDIAPSANDNNRVVGYKSATDWIFSTYSSSGLVSSISVADSLLVGWHHFAFRWGAENGMFIDGVLVRSVTSAANLPTSVSGNIFLGCRYNSTAFIDSYMRNVKVSRTWRNDIEILDDFETGINYDDWDVTYILLCDEDMKTERRSGTANTTGDMLKAAKTGSPVYLKEDTQASFNNNISTQLCTNGDFETNTTGWGASQDTGTATISSSTDWAATGTSSLKVVSGTGGTLFTSYFDLTAAADDMIYATFTMKSVSGGAAFARIFSRTGGYHSIITTDHTFTAGEIKTIELSGKIDASGTCGLEVIHQNEGAAGVIFYIDNVIIEKNCHAIETHANGTITIVKYGTDAATRIETSEADWGVSAGSDSVQSNADGTLSLTTAGPATVDADSSLSGTMGSGVLTNTQVNADGTLGLLASPGTNATVTYTSNADFTKTGTSTSPNGSVIVQNVGGDDRLKLQLQYFNIGIGYDSAKKHVITGTADGAQTNYTMRFKIYRDSGTDSVTAANVAIPQTANIYLNAGSKAWPNDFRFTNANGIILPHWTETYTNAGAGAGDYAIVWVKVDSIPLSPATVSIYLHYGKTGDTSGSDITSTYLLGDNFAAANAGRWTASIGSQGGINYNQPGMDIFGIANGNGRTTLTSVGTYPVNNVAVRWIYYAAMTPGNDGRNDGKNESWIYPGVSSTWGHQIYSYLYWDGQMYEHTTSDFKFFTSSTLRYENHSSVGNWWAGPFDTEIRTTASGITVYKNNVQVYSGGFSGFSNTNYKFETAINTDNSGFGYLHTKVPFFAVRKWTPNEPAHTSTTAITDPFRYNYRKQHTINGTNDGAQTNYVMRFVVHRAGGTDSTDSATFPATRHIYLGSSVTTDPERPQSWPYDVKFTNAATGAWLDYWMESSTTTAWGEANTDTAVFWVEIDSIPSGSGSSMNIYVYWGKPSETDGSNIDGTFIFSDKFSLSTIDSSKWTQNVSGDAKVVWDSANGDVEIASCSSASSAYITTKAAFPINGVSVRTRYRAHHEAGSGGNPPYDWAAREAHVRPVTDNSWQLGSYIYPFASANYLEQFYTNGTSRETYGTIPGSGGAGQYSLNNAPDTIELYSAMIDWAVSTTASQAYLRRNNTAVGNWALSALSPSQYRLKATGLESSSQGYLFTRWDLITIRKWTLNEPSHGNTGTAECNYSSGIWSSAGDVVSVTGYVESGTVTWNPAPAGQPAGTSAVVKVKITGPSSFDTGWLTIAASGDTIPAIVGARTGSYTIYHEITLTADASYQYTPFISDISTTLVVKTYAASGTRVTPSLDLSGTDICGTATVSWNSVVPANTSVQIETSVTGGTSGDHGWQVISTDATGSAVIPYLVMGQNLAGTAAQVRLTLGTTDNSITSHFTSVTVDVQPGTSTSGYRISPAYSLNGVNTVGNSVVSWATKAGTPTNTTLSVYAAMSADAAPAVNLTNLPVIPDWTLCEVSGDDISIIPMGTYVVGKNLYILQVFTSDGSATPYLDSLTVGVTSMYPTSAYRISPVLNLSGVGKARNSKVSWSPDIGCGVSVSTDATAWQAVSGSGAENPLAYAGMDCTDVKMFIKETLTSDGLSTPTFDSVETWIRPAFQQTSAIILPGININNAGTAEVATITYNGSASITLESSVDGSTWADCTDGTIDTVPDGYSCAGKTLQIRATLTSNYITTPMLTDATVAVISRNTEYVALKTTQLRPNSLKSVYIKCTTPLHSWYGLVSEKAAAAANTQYTVSIFTRGTTDSMHIHVRAYNSGDVLLSTPGDITLSGLNDGAWTVHYASFTTPLTTAKLDVWIEAIGASNIYLDDLILISSSNDIELKVSRTNGSLWHSVPVVWSGAFWSLNTDLPVIITENFDDGDLSDLTLYGTGGPTKSIADGKLILTSGGTDARVKFDELDHDITNFTAEYDVKAPAGDGKASLIYRTTWWEDENNTFAYAVDLGVNLIRLSKGSNADAPSWVEIISATPTLTAGTTYHVKVIVNGNIHKVLVDGIQYINVTDASFPAAGRIGLRLFSATVGNTTTFDNFLLTEHIDDLIVANGADFDFNASTGWTLSNATVGGGKLTLTSPDGSTPATATCTFSNVFCGISGSSYTEHWKVSMCAKYANTSGSAGDITTTFTGMGWTTNPSSFVIGNTNISSTLMKEFQSIDLSSNNPPGTGTVTFKLSTLSTRPVEIEWVKAIPVENNRFKYRMTLNSDAETRTKTPYVESAVFINKTDTDTKIKEGVIDEFDSPLSSDDTLTIDLGRINRDDGIGNIQKLTGQDAWVDSNGRLQVKNNPPGRGSELSKTLLVGKDVSVLNVKRSREPLATALTLVGSGQISDAISIEGTSNMEDDAAIALYGRVEKVVTEKGLSDQGAINLRCYQKLQQLKVPEETVSATAFDGRVVDWEVGDSVLINDPTKTTGIVNRRLRIAKATRAFGVQGEAVQFEFTNINTDLKAGFENAMSRMDDYMGKKQEGLEPQQVSFVDNCDNTRPVEVLLYIDESRKEAIQDILFFCYSRPFRATSKSASVSDVNTSDGGTSHNHNITFESHHHSFNLPVHMHLLTPGYGWHSHYHDGVGAAYPEELSLINGTNGLVGTPSTAESDTSSEEGGSTETSDSGQTHTHNIPAHDHPIEYGIYDTGYYAPCKMFINDDTFSNPYIPFGMQGSETEAFQVTKMSLLGSYDSEFNAALHPGVNFIYIQPQVTTNNAHGLLRLYIDVRVIYRQ